MLRATFSDGAAEPPNDVQQLSNEERNWLIGHLEDPGFTDVHSGLLIAAISEAMSDHDSIIEDVVESLRSRSGRYRNFNLTWPVALNVLSDDDRVVDIVCDQLRSEENSILMLRLTFDDEQLLASAYPLESPQKVRVAAAIEERLSTFGMEHRDRELFGLAAVDRGPLMKEALLRQLRESSVPHWAAEALIAYFCDDTEARAALHLVLMGDPERASMIANVATRVLATSEVAPRLLAISRGLSESTASRRGRSDIVASAMVRTCHEQGVGPEIESVVGEMLKLLPPPSHPLFGDPRYDLAVACHPSPTSKTALAELADAEDRPLEPYLYAFRNDPEQVQPFLEDAAKVLRSACLNTYAHGCVNRLRIWRLLPMWSWT